ncbi:major facilitator superfamily MFS_1 [Mycolicibacterium rhodesiae JS60]|nr:major facilitator superfamily MFS_1 [Mycolicibacterium rhodesiae JS60]
MTMALVGFVMAMTAPIELLYAIKLGLSTAEVTVFILVSALGVVAVDVLGTRAITRIDARATIASGLLLFAASEGCYALSHTATGLYASRVLQGLASAAIAGAALQIAVRMHSRPHHVLGSNQGLQLFGAAFGAPAGGILAGLFAGLQGYRLSFVVCAGLGVVVALVAVLLLPRLAPPPDSGRPRIGLPNFTMPPVLRLALTLGLFGNYLRSGIENTALPLIGHAYGLSAANIGVALGLLSAVEIGVLALSGRLFDRIPPARCLGIALLLGIAAVVLLATVHDLPGFLAAAALFGIVDGVALSAPPVLIVALSSNASAGVATYRIACGVGSFLGAGSVNLLIAVLGTASGLGVVSAVLVLGAVLARSTGRRIPPESAVPG